MKHSDHPPPDERHPGWAPESCTLPTADQPLRVAEFDDLFARSLRSVERLSDRTARLILAAGAADQAADLAARESNCCSFFDFDVVTGPDGTVSLRVTVPAARTPVLDALTARAAAAAGLDGRRS